MNMSEKGWFAVIAALVTVIGTITVAFIDRGVFDRIFDVRPGVREERPAPAATPINVPPARQENTGQGGISPPTTPVSLRVTPTIPTPQR